MSAILVLYSGIKGYRYGAVGYTRPAPGLGIEGRPPGGGGGGGGPPIPGGGGGGGGGGGMSKVKVDEALGPVRAVARRGVFQRPMLVCVTVTGRVGEGGVARDGAERMDRELVLNDTRRALRELAE